MSTQITSVNIGSIQDKRLTLGNSQVARLLDIGNSFVRIRIGFRLAFADTGANLVGTPRFWVGLLSNPAVGMTNGPLSAATSHFVGAVTNAGLWTRSTSPIIRYETSGTGSAIKRVGAVNTVAAAGNFPINVVSASPSTMRSVCLLDITKGSPNFTISAVLNSTSVGMATGDITMPELIAAMEISSLAGAATQLSTFAGQSYSTDGPYSVAVNETTDGPLNSLCWAWDRLIPLFHLSEAFYCTFPT